MFACPSLLARSIRQAVLALSLSGSLLTTAAWAEPLSYSIPAGSLAAALTQFAAASGVTISFSSQETTGLSSNGLRGEYEVEHGFSRLLQGTGLQVQAAGDKRYVLLRPSQDAALELGATTVSSAQLGATTEGTGSYTTGATNTATKLNLSMRETPQAVTVMTRQRMDDQAMTNISDVVKNTPGLYLNKSDGPDRPAFSARGFDVDNVMYDGLPSYYQGWKMGAQPNLAMFDRVEVIRGATGLVSGSGNPSAGINLVRKRPTADTRVSLTGAAGSWDDYRGEVDVSGALNDSGTLRGRVVGNYRDSHGFRDKEQHDHGLFYAIGEADLSDSTTLAVGFSRQEDQTNLFWGGLPVGLEGRHLDLSRSTYPGSDWEDKHLKINTLFTDLEHRFANDWKLRLSAMHSWQDGLFSGTYLRRDAALDMYHQAFQARYEDDRDAFDLNASGPLELFGRRHEVVFGASEREQGQVTRNYDGGAMIALNAPKPDFVRSGKSEESTTQRGVYLTTRFSLADPLTLILGGRLDWYEYDNHSADGDYKVTRNLTRYAGVIYDLDQHHSLYASYTDIFQPQSAKDVSQKVLEPIIGENYEVGIKGEYFDGALNASLALFQIDQQNRAATDYDAPMVCDGWYCSKASGSVRSQGLDVELQGALSDNWQVGAGYTYSRARYRHDADASLEGQRFDTDTPEHLFKLSTLYRLPGQLEKWRVGGSLYWQNRVYSDVALPDGSNYRLQQGSYASVDLLAGYQVNEHLDLQFNVNNVLDRTYYSAIGYDIYWGSMDNYGDPRSYLLTAKYAF